MSINGFSSWKIARVVLRTFTRGKVDSIAALNRDDANVDDSCAVDAQPSVQLCANAKRFIMSICRQNYSASSEDAINEQVSTSLPRLAGAAP